MRLAPRRTAVLAAAALVLPLAAVAAQASAPAAAVAQAPGRTPTLPSKVAPVSGLTVENSFVSSTGWVKPGDAYPSRILLTNAAKTAAGAVSLSIPAVKGMTWTQARAAAGTAALSGGTVTWKVASVPAGSTLALVLEARAKTTAQEPTVVWRDISSIATVTAGGATKRIASHGPKVIPSSGGFESARYGDRPFPVVPVDYVDFKHTASAAELDKTINDPANPSSTFNLFQEISFGQLYPHGTVGSAGVASRPVAASDRLKFSKPEPTQTNTCTGTTTVNPLDGTPSSGYTERVNDGWYQLPGMRNYYGQDANGSALVGAVAGVAALQAIDSGCGPTAKAAYDAAVVADPDIDYSDFDTDKDGVVDFFEVIFQGCGGNGDSQTAGALGSCGEAPNDNIWPHSSSLEFTYTDPTTGLSGYISHDQLKNLEGQPLWYTDKSYTAKTTRNTGDALKVFVRVGPYNVNPETAIDKASVISHEYGHSLGLPDYYSTGSRETYGDFTLMATDKSQNMDVIAKKELGWIVPDVLEPSKTKAVKDWQDSKIDTGTIHWVTPSGTPYALSAAAGDYGIHNGEAYVASLPGRQLLDPKKISQGASGKQVWYSGQGNDFGCPPNGGHNFDITIPGLDQVPAGTKVTASFTSFFEIEWDYDYGFVLSGKPDSKGAYSYTSHPSANGYTTPATSNPNQNTCQSKYGNGLTGTPSSYDSGTAPVDRVAGNYPDSPFVADSYDVSDLAGVKGGVLRLSYATDPGTAKLGWIIDDLVVKAGDKVLFSSDFEKDGGPTDPRVYSGGCKEDLSVSGGVCTQGWQYVAAGTPSELEHAYLLEMRDRSGFDFDGRGENDRDPIAFQPGLLLTYTDEAHGYGNAGTDDPPAQSPLDAKPTPEDATPDLNDATFTNASGRSRFSDQRGSGAHVDNYSEPTRNEELDPDGDGSQPWTFDYSCLTFDVTRIDGDTGNAADKYDLVGDATLVTKAGCAPFNYGFAAATRTPAKDVPSTPSGSETGNGQGNGQDNGGNADGEESGSGSAPGPTATGSGLPRTGQDVAAAVAIALLMLTGGGWLAASRRRRTA